MLCQPLGAPVPLADSRCMPQVTNLEQVYLRGSQIRYFILPDMLRHAPMFKKKALDRFRDRADRTFQNPGGPQKSHLAVCQNLVPLVNIKIAGKWMFIPLKMVLIGIDPYPSRIASL